MAIYTTTVRNHLEKAQDDLFNFIVGFDWDLSGQNGEDFTYDEALEEGFTSTMEYFLKEALKETKDVGEFIEIVMSNVRRTYSGYDYAEFDVSELNENEFLVVFARSDG